MDQFAGDIAAALELALIGSGLVAMGFSGSCGRSGFPLGSML